MLPVIIVFVWFLWNCFFVAELFAVEEFFIRRTFLSVEAVNQEMEFIAVELAYPDAWELCSAEEQIGVTSPN